MKINTLFIILAIAIIYLLWTNLKNDKEQPRHVRFRSTQDQIREFNKSEAPIAVGTGPFGVFTGHQPSRQWTLVGSAISTSTTDDTILSLYKRDSLTNRNRFQYEVRNKDTGVTVLLNDGEDMNELYEDDSISVTGYESVGSFTVVLDPVEPTIRYRV